jgi:hypothetical protein
MKIDFYTKLPEEKIKEIYGNADTNWVPEGRQSLLEGLNLALHNSPVIILKAIYILLDCNKEPTDEVDRCRAGLYF